VAARPLNGPASRRVCFINRKGGLVHSRHAYSSLGELPAAVDLVVLAVPAGGFEQAVDEARAAGAVMIGPHCPGIADTTSGLSGLCIVAATVNARSPAASELRAGGIPRCTGR